MTTNCPECGHLLSVAQETEHLKKQERCSILHEIQEAQEEWRKRYPQGTQGTYGPEKYYLGEVIYFFPACVFFLMGLLTYTIDNSGSGIIWACLGGFGGFGILISILQTNWKNYKEPKKWLTTKMQFLKEKPDQAKRVFREIPDESI
ncbi:MAG: hypothetical protein Q7S34_00145 [bacterium]|nr:hypothetical protein [bacterium]